MSKRKRFQLEEVVNKKRKISIETNNSTEDNSSLRELKRKIEYFTESNKKKKIEHHNISLCMLYNWGSFGYSNKPFLDDCLISKKLLESKEIVYVS